MRAAAWPPARACGRRRGRPELGVRCRRRRRPRQLRRSQRLPKHLLLQIIHPHLTSSASSSGGKARRRADAGAWACVRRQVWSVPCCDAMRCGRVAVRCGTHGREVRIEPKRLGNHRPKHLDKSPTVSRPCPSPFVPLPKSSEHGPGCESGSSGSIRWGWGGGALRYARTRGPQFPPPPACSRAAPTGSACSSGTVVSRWGSAFVCGRAAVRSIDQPPAARPAPAAEPAAPARAVAGGRTCWRRTTLSSGRKAAHSVPVAGRAARLGC